MPIYEYRCAACGHEVEALQKLADAPLRVCPACHKPELQKQLSAAGFQLKGSGWYVTDFRNRDGKPPAKDKPAAGDAASGNGNAAAPASGDGAGGGAAKGEKTGTGEKPASSTTTDSKPATSVPPASKPDT